MPSPSRRRLALLAGVAAAGVSAYFLIADQLESRRAAAVHDAVARRDFADALRRLDEHLARRPEDLDARLSAARTARRADDFAAADRHLDAYRDAGGDAAAVTLERLLRRSQAGDLTGDANVLHFVATQPDHPSAAFMIEALARGYLAAGRPRQAVQAADVWLRQPLSPADRGFALFVRAQGLERQALVPDAIRGYRDALAADPSAAAAKLALARVYVRESPAEARPLLEELLAIGYRPAAVELSLAACLRQLGEHDRAADLLAKRTAEEPDAPAVLVEAAKLALDRRRPADAEPLLRRAVTLAPKDRDANVQLARCLQELGRDAEAREQAAAVEKLDAELLPPTGKKP